MAAQASLKIFAIAALVLQVFFALIYSFHAGFVGGLAFDEINGLLTAVFLTMLLLVGFGLLSTYLKNFSIGGLTLTFIIVAFTIQWYFLMRIFWTGVNVADSENALYFGDRFNYLRLTKENNRANTEVMSEFTLSEAIACAICMFVALFPNLGKVGPLETLIMCFVGIFGYALNESAFWRLFINDNGYGMRIFLFGSVLGLVSSRILGKKEETRSHKNYYSEYNFQTFGLLGAIFIWILLPWLSTIGQGTFNTADFRQVAPLNIWYALSASCCASFMTSIWIHGKISVHEIVFGCFSGAIAYGSSSNVFPRPFPAMLIGTIAGIVVTFLNSRKKSYNEDGVVDSLGGFFLFFVSSLIGAIYSAILFATQAYGVDYSSEKAQVDQSRTQYIVGGYQLAGLAITLGIAAFAGVIVGFLFRAVNRLEGQEFFNDSTYIQKDAESALKQSQIHVVD